MTFLDNALTLITLASLFILGPALGRVVVSCFDWEKCPVPIRHFLVGFGTLGGANILA
jgi:hypothetical protein